MTSFFYAIAKLLSATWLGVDEFEISMKYLQPSSRGYDFYLQTTLRELQHEAMMLHVASILSPKPQGIFVQLHQCVLKGDSMQWVPGDIMALINKH